MRIGLTIVGDEILSGRRVDKHLPAVVEMLKQRGLALNWCRIVGDDNELLEATLRDSFASGDLVFSTGGIGGTPDDLTREAAARALNSHTERHPQGLEILKDFARERNRELKPVHYRMIEFPRGSELIPNPVNRIPGFSIRDHHFVPGFPEMAAPMIEWVLDNRYAHLADDQYTERAIMVYGQYESAMIPIMESVLVTYPGIKVFSLPVISEEKPRVELGVKGGLQQVTAAMADMASQLEAIGAAFEYISIDI